MSGQDNVIFNTQERALSSDVNNLESIKDRSFLEAMKYMMESRSDAGTPGFPTQSLRSVVLGGLSVVPSGTDIQVGPGVMVQNSPTLAPAPGALDSTYRIARNASATVVTMPAPVSDTFYLIEAKMVAVITQTASRDIWNTGTSTFIPAVVNKIEERQIQFQVVAGVGGNYPAPSGGDWVVIAGVKRPAGGPAVVAADINYIRTHWSDFAGVDQDTSPIFEFGNAPRLSPVHIPGGSVSNLVNVNTSVRYRGQKMHLFGVNLDLTSATYVSPSVTLTASTWYYVYLAPFAGMPPSNFYPNVTHRGVLVVSSVTPGSTQLPFNSASIAAPAPWGTIAADTAVCIGSLRRNAANTGWDAQSMGGSQIMIEPITLFAAGFTGATYDTVALLGSVPLNAQSFLVRGFIDSFGAAGPVNVQYKAPANSTGVTVANSNVTPTSAMNFDFEVPTEWVPTFSMDVRTVNAANGTLTLMGYTVRQ